MNWETVVHREISWERLEAIQKVLVNEVRAVPTKAYLLISEPLPTFTYGRNAELKDLIWSPSQLDHSQAKVAKVSRGGKWTFHGPGQILIYPIMHLPSWGYSSKSVRAFLEDFRDSILEPLNALGCSKLEKGEPFGIYSQNKKLASFGLAFERSISSHGMALYLTDQSRFFSGINPCGITNGASTCLGDNITDFGSWDSVATLLGDSIKKRFSFRLSRVL